MSQTEVDLLCPFMSPDILYKINWNREKGCILIREGKGWVIHRKKVKKGIEMDLCTKLWTLSTENLQKFEVYIDIL